MNPKFTFQKFITCIQQVTALSVVGLTLSGCVFGENKQFFEGAANAVAAAIPTPTPAASASPTPALASGTTPSPSATPASGITPTPTPVLGGGSTPTPTPNPIFSPTPTATPVSTPTPTPTPVSGGSTPTPTPSATPRPTATPAPATPTPTGTPTPTATPTGTPVAVNDGPYEIAVNQTLTIQTSALLQNDYDPNGLPIHFTGYATASSGTLTQSGNTLSFQPSNNFTGTVSFAYTIANSLNLSAQASVTINVRTAATEVMYGQSSSTLYLYNPGTHSTTKVANFKLANGSSVSIRDIAITSNGLMYGVDGTSLYYINASTGVLTKIQTTGLGSFGNINGLTALSDGDLVISGNGIAIYNIAAQTLTTLLAPGSYQSSGDIIALPDGYLYMSTVNNGSDHFIRVDPHSGATTDLGSTGHTEVYGLGYAFGALYGFADNGQVFNINTTANSVSTSNVVNTSIEWYGATTNPVLWGN